MKIKFKKPKTTKQRTTWGFNPVSRVVESKKIYKRTNYKKISWS